MTSVQGHAASPSSGQGLYVYRGRNPIAPKRERVEIDTSPYDAPRSRSIPQCAVCSSTGEKLVGGWWCSSCESPIA